MDRSQLARFDLPDVPGVYLFTKGRGKSKKILYVGKATSLRDRVRSYFDDDLIATRGPRLVDMVTQADGIMHETTPTVLEALVREAALIREYHPSANAMGKDDKTFLYAVITDEEIPRVLAIRGSDIDFDKKVSGDIKIKAIHGPFPSGYQLREGLRLIRRIFPFYDTARPLHEMSRTRNKHTRDHIEFNRQIGQYPRSMDRKEYLRSIRNVSLFLSGRVKALRTTLTREMKEAAKKERFEDAAEIRRQLFALDHIQDVSLIKEDRHSEQSAPRIEAYDTAHISGTNAIGVMTVVENGVPIKQDYRTFKIKGMMQKDTGKTREARRINDDIASLKEILSRRMGHPEWQMPRAIIVDGGRTHKKAAESVLNELGIGIPVVAVVKDEKHRPREVIGALRSGVSEADAVLANAEAHRFSLAKHRAARNRSMRKT
ncbi:MAG: UvrB/UvrC motif-containing protein [Candidatus Pacebacteria bacterium]|nr:UvrB/UvrC motif-containing protein [Candidatus Paceibacterota bacterium]